MQIYFAYIKFNLARVPEICSAYIPSDSPVSGYPVHLDLLLEDERERAAEVAVEHVQHVGLGHARVEDGAVGAPVKAVKKNC